MSSHEASRHLVDDVLAPSRRYLQTVSPNRVGAPLDPVGQITRAGRMRVLNSVDGLTRVARTAALGSVNEMTRANRHRTIGAMVGAGRIGVPDAGLGPVRGMIRRGRVTAPDPMSRRLLVDGASGVRRSDVRKAIAISKVWSGLVRPPDAPSLRRCAGRFREPARWWDLLLHARRLGPRSALSLLRDFLRATACGSAWEIPPAWRVQIHTALVEMASVMTSHGPPRGLGAQPRSPRGELEVSAT